MMTTKKIPYSPRYDFIFNRINDFHNIYGYDIYPFNPIAFIKSNSWILESYQSIAANDHVPIQKIYKSHKNALGKVYLLNNRYSIVYDADKPIRMILFTLTHEICHILLHHLVDFDETILMRGGLSEKKYSVLETEADVMAKNLLAPYYILKNAQFKNWKDIYNIFNLSKKASKTRLASLNSDEKSYGHQNSSNEYFAQIDINSYRNYHKCYNCGYLFRPEGKYCTICGNTSSKKSYSLCLATSYEYFSVYDGHLDICPNCKQEIETCEDRFCKICGHKLQNYCPSCGADLNFNDRYCCFCGNPSLFSSFLPTWESIYDDTLLQEKIKYNLRIY